MNKLNNKPDQPKVPEFAIFQNSRTKVSGIWKNGKWTSTPVKDYHHLRLLATLIRTDPNPVEIIRAIEKENPPK